MAKTGICKKCGKKTSYHKCVFCRKCYFENNVGSNNPSWKGGISKPACKKCGKKISHKATHCNKCRDRNADKNPKWRGGIVNTHEGYIQIYSPDHPNKNNYGYVLAHRLKMEKKIGRYLNKNEIVHHKNGIVKDNRISNLLLCTVSEHAKIHYKEKLCRWSAIITKTGGKHGT